jgi:hypothetical protein
MGPMPANDQATLVISASLSRQLAGSIGPAYAVVTLTGPLPGGRCPNLSKHGKG